MTIASAFNIINTSFATLGLESSTVATNVANANTPGYSAQVAHLGTTAYNGVHVYSITRDANAALTAQVDQATSDSATQSAISAGLATLAQTVDDSSSNTSTSGALQNGSSPYAALAGLQSALTSLQASPSSQASAQAAVAAAKNVAAALNSGAQTVQQVRTQADQQISQAVSSVNSLLSQFQTVNNSIVGGLAAGANVNTMLDTRDSLVSQISQQIGVTTSLNGNGSMSIFTDSGVTLFDVAPYQLSFSPSGALGPNQTGGQVTVNGQPVTGSSANMPIQTGAIAGLVQLRDVTAPQYQSQLDQIAGNLISAFQETDQSTTSPGLPPLPGLFTTAGATAVPAPTNYTGLSNAIEINPTVDPSQGGNPMLMRDGGISDTADTNYTYNTTGAAGYSGRIQGLISALGTQMSFSPAAGLGPTNSLTGYSNASVSWLQAANQQASSNASYQQSLLTQASSALSNATGVNLDSELTNMLSIESSYTASAKLMTTVNAMLQTLVNAVNP